MDWDSVSTRFKKLFTALAIPGWIITLWNWFWRVVGWLGNLDLLQQYWEPIRRIARMLNPPALGTILTVVGIMWLGIVILWGDTIKQRISARKLASVVVIIVAVGLTVGIVMNLHRSIRGNLPIQEPPTQASKPPSENQPGNSKPKDTAPIASDDQGRKEKKHTPALGARPKKVAGETTEQKQEPNPAGSSGFAAIGCSPSTTGLPNCQDLEIRNNRFGNTNSVLDNSGKASNVFIGGSVVKPPLGGGDATVVKNRPGGEIAGLTITDSSVGTSAWWLDFADKVTEHAGDRGKIQELMNKLREQCVVKWKNLPEDQKEANLKELAEKEQAILNLVNDKTALFEELHKVPSFVK